MYIQNICLHIHTYVRTYMRTYAHAYIRTYIYTQTLSHTHTHLSSQHADEVPATEAAKILDKASEVERLQFEDRLSGRFLHVDS